MEQSLQGKFNDPMFNRIVVLDTETTGFSCDTGDKIVEIGAIEYIDRKPTGRVFHEYVDPEREVPDEAVAVHGWTREDLIAAGKGQKFRHVAQKLQDFISGATLVIHNAPFDMGFLDYEFNAIQMQKPSTLCKVFDTLKFANQMYPGKRNNLDSLSRRLGIDNSNRTLHGALLDSEILAEVYLVMTQNQNNLTFSNSNIENQNTQRAALNFQSVNIPGLNNLQVIAPDENENMEHKKILARIAKESGGNTLWPSF